MKFSAEGKLAVLTGAASGIGASLARALAVRGAHLALVDRDAAGIQAVARDIGFLVSKCLSIKPTYPNRRQFRRCRKRCLKRIPAPGSGC